jgi:hypothetical protein
MRKLTNRYGQIVLGSAKGRKLTRNTLEQRGKVEGTVEVSALCGDRALDVPSRIAQLECENHLLRLLLCQLEGQRPTFN